MLQTVAPLFVVLFFCVMLFDYHGNYDCSRSRHLVCGNADSPFENLNATEFDNGYIQEITNNDVFCYLEKLIQQGDCDMNSFYHDEALLIVKTTTEQTDRHRYYYNSASFCDGADQMTASESKPSKRLKHQVNTRTYRMHNQPMLFFLVTITKTILQRLSLTSYIFTRRNMPTRLLFNPKGCG